jgi:Transposase and inactivated derivatives
MKYEAIRTYSPEFSVAKMCKVLGLTAGSYYNWLRRLEEKESKKYAERKLIEVVRKLFLDNKKAYGYRKMQRALRKEGIMLSEYRIRRIMRENGLYPQYLDKYKVPRRRNPGGRFFENIVNQEFRPSGPNKVWAGDITYIKTGLGWVYLAAVMDLYNKEIIGYAVSKSIDTELVRHALANALTRTNGGGEDTIFHSDRGIQYSSKSFQHMLEEHGIIGSMSRSGCPYDNACLESFFSTAKRESLLRKEFVSVEEVKRELFEYIELFYNRKRMHQSLDYMAPIEYRLTSPEKKIA